MNDLGRVVRSYLASRKRYAEGGDVTADDMIEQARERLATQPQRMRNILPDVGEPLIGDGGQLSPGTAWGNKAVDVGSRLVKGMGEGLVEQGKTPGALMKPNPYPPGSEEAVWYDNQRADAGVHWAPGMALNTMGTGAIVGVPVKGAETVLGAGAVRKGKGTTGAHLPEDAAVVDHAAAPPYTPPHEPAAAAPAEAVLDVGRGLEGPSGGGEGLREAQLSAQRRAASREPLPGLPQGPQVVEGQPFVPGPFGLAHDVAERYMASREGAPSLHYRAPEKYHEIDPEHSAAIAQAFEEMKHAPNDPAVKASYDALIKETLAQYQAIKESGLKITPVNAADYPYHGNPRAVARDVADNNHMAFFKTDEGFGTRASEVIGRTTREGTYYEVLKNPTKSELIKVARDYPTMGRGVPQMRVMKSGNDVYAWPASYATHDDIGKALKIKAPMEGRDNLQIGRGGKLEGGKQDWDAVLNPASENPMLLPSGEKIGEHNMLNNDVFRVVHDYFGHIKNGYGFRATGEDNAWRAHAAMYSDLARPAMTTETRGQNSWVNYGPHGEKNRTASGADTIYADQKVGLMPDWTMYDKGKAPPMMYHGSAAEYLRPDLNRLGSGQGEMAYGAGYYGSQGERVGQRYRDMQAPKQWTLNGQPASLLHAYENMRDSLMITGTSAGRAEHVADAIGQLMEHGYSPAKIKTMVDREGMEKEFATALKVASRYKNTESPGHMYKWAIEADPQHLLNWDTSFGQQTPHVQGRVGEEMTSSLANQKQALERSIERLMGRQASGSTGVARIRRDRDLFEAQKSLARFEQLGLDNLIGKDIYKRMGLPANDQTEAYLRAAQRLRDRGIPGLRYKNISGGADSGVPNYVMFDPDKLRLLRRYADGGEVDAEGMAPENYEQMGTVGRGVLNVLRGIADIPRRAFQSSETMRTTGEYDPGPVLDAAMLPMGTGAIAGVPVKGGEVALGAGALRRAKGSTGVHLPKSFDDLPAETKADIAHSLMERIPTLNEHARGRVEDVQALLDGALPTLNVGHHTVDPKVVDISGRSVSPRAVEKYAGLTTEPPPVVMSGPDLIEGGHRIAAGQKTGRHVPAVDISDLLKMDWKDWLNGGTGTKRYTQRTPTYYEHELNTAGNPIINKGVENPPNPRVQTVADPHRMMFPGIYGNPREIAATAAARVGVEDPAMKRLFGVTRGDLREMAQGRVGNEEPALTLAKNPRGSVAAQNIQTPQNTQRIVDILDEAGKHEGLRTADAWYIQDPVYNRMKEMGANDPTAQYRHFNTMTAMASPGSDVLTEIQRGTAAHWLAKQGRFNDFEKYAGVPEYMRNRMKFPADMRYIEGHPYHRTSQGDPMAKYLEHGEIRSDAAKVPLYAHASGVPETGFQTKGPVGDAHFSRGVGLADTRKGPTYVGSSFSKPEYQTLQPWWQHDVAGKVGLESVPAQARLWTTLGPQTGVESALGAPKLELLSQQIMEAARRLRVSPEKARDLILSGKAGAGKRGGAVGPNFAEGGAIGDDYNTPVDEAAFQGWRAVNAPDDSGVDYDLRGAYQANMQRAENGHMTDRFKKPNHPTFSDQSQYATGDQRARAGHWVGDTFVPPSYAEGGATGLPPAPWATTPTDDDAAPKKAALPAAPWVTTDAPAVPISGAETIVSVPPPTSSPKTAGPSWLETAKGAARGPLNFLGDMGEAVAGPFGPSKHAANLYATLTGGERPKPDEPYSTQMHKAAGVDSTNPGYGGSIAEVATNPASWIGPGGPVAKAALAGATGAGGQLGHDLTEGTGYESLGRAAGALAAGPLAARAIKPQLAPQQQMLADAGVRQTPGQLAGGIFKDAEDKLTSFPILGHFITTARGRSVDSFNRAVANQALEPIGQRVMPRTEPGHQMVAEVEHRLGAAYDRLVPHLQFAPDRQFAFDMLAIHQRNHGQLPPAQVEQFNNIIAASFGRGGNMTGQKIKTIEEELGKIGRNYSSSPMPAERSLGYAVTDTLRALRSNLERVNPQHAEELRQINSGWAMYVRMRDAASRRVSSEGVFMPSDLLAAVKRGDQSVGKGAFARGDALMQDFAEAGQRVLPSKVPDSGTPGRALLTAAAGLVGHGQGYIPKSVLAGVAGASGLYTRPSTWLLNRYASPTQGARAGYSNAGRGAGTAAAPLATNPFGDATNPYAP